MFFGIAGLDRSLSDVEASGYAVREGARVRRVRGSRRRRTASESRPASWACAPGVLGLWRYVLRRYPGPYELRLWNVVFPRGMYTVASGLRQIAGLAVRFQYESHDPSGQWWRSYGNEMWEFDEHGLMRRREASINDVRIDESDRRIFGPRPPDERGRDNPLR